MALNAFTRAVVATGLATTSLSGPFNQTAEARDGAGAFIGGLAAGAIIGGVIANQGRGGYGYPQPRGYYGGQQGYGTSGPGYYRDPNKEYADQPTRRERSGCLVQQFRYDGNPGGTRDVCRGRGAPQYGGQQYYAPQRPYPVQGIPSYGYTR